MDILQYVLNLGPSIVLPLIIFILCMVFRMKIGRAVRASLTIGVGFIAINLVIGLMATTLGTATSAMVENTGLDLPIVDVGWPVAAAISFGTASIVPWIFVLGILVNLGMIAVKWTQTLNVDMWNYWHFIFSAAFVYATTGNFFLGIAVGVVTSIIILKLADFVAPVIQDTYGMPNITTPHTETVNWAPVSWTINKMIDRVPGLNRLNATRRLQERFGVIAEPLIMGTVLGLAIALIGFAPGFATDPGDALQKVLNTAITMGAVMMVLPRMVGILMEGLVPLSDAAQEWITSRFPGRELNIGLDAAILIGFPANITVGIILVPITLVLAIVMSLLGLNQMLPFTDLAVLPFYAIWATTWCRGNIVRGTIIGTFFIACMLSIATFLAPPTTQLAADAGFTMPEGATLISSIDSGAHVLPFMLVFGFIAGQISQYGVGFMIWISFILIFSLVSYIVFYIYIARGNVPGMTDKHLYATAEDASWDDDQSDWGDSSWDDAGDSATDGPEEASR